MKINTLFLSKNQLILTEAHCSYFSVDFRLICSYFLLRQLSTSKKGDSSWRMGNPSFSAKVLNFLLQQQPWRIPHFLQWRNTRLCKSRIYWLVLNLFCFKIPCLYSCLSISVSKSCQTVINIYTVIIIYIFDCLHPAWCCPKIILNFLAIWTSLFLRNEFLVKKKCTLFGQI